MFTVEGAIPFSIMWYQIFLETESYFSSVGKQENRALLALTGRLSGNTNARNALSIKRCSCLLTKTGSGA